MLLKLDGHDVETAKDGVHGIERAAVFHPDLILLDIGMPTLDGYAVARRIHSLALVPKPYLVAVTGYGKRDDQRRSGEAGIDLHLCKPVDLETYQGLAALVQTASGIVGRAHSLTEQNQEVTTDLMFQQMDMANVYLDVAANASMDGHKDQCIAQATGARNKVSRWLESGACRDDRVAAMVNRLQLLSTRNGGVDAQPSNPPSNHTPGGSISRAKCRCCESASANSPNALGASSTSR